MYTMLLVVFLSGSPSGAQDSVVSVSQRVSSVADCYRTARSQKSSMTRVYGNKYKDIKFEMSCKKQSNR